MTSRVLVVEHEAGAPAGLVGEWLEQAGAVLDVRRPYADGPGALPEDLSAHDALLVLGGSMGAHDDAHHAWLAPTRDLVREAAATGVPTLGICLGHQLVAVALGGRSAPNPAGQQLGRLAVGWCDDAPQDALLGSAAVAERGLHWNDDVVLDLPEGAVVLARAPGGEVQAARFAPTVWGVQLHPEVDERIVAGWGQEDRERLGDERGPEVARNGAGARAELEAGWRPLAHRLAQLAAGSRTRRPTP